MSSGALARDYSRRVPDDLRPFYVVTYERGTNMFIDFSAIQTVPSSNINRDDTGSPKTAIYGGVRRARVSSQAWKRAMRQEFRELLPEGSLGVRTKFAAELIASRIVTMRPDLQEQASDLAAATLKALGMKVEKSTRAGDDEGKAQTGYLVFISNAELEKLATIAIGWADGGVDWAKPGKDQKKEAVAAFHGVQAVDIALFGRMLADVPELNVDAACQVAHAISVDKVTQEYDYFTAVDDATSDDNAGAAMLDTVSFNSSTLYRYATVNVDSLFAQLGSADATAEAVAAFAEAFIRSMPTGKQNTFANRTLPNAVLVSVRDRQPINAVTAFEDPVRRREGNPISHQAAVLLAKKVKSIEEGYDMPARKSWNIVDGPAIEELDEISSNVDLGGLVAQLRDEVLADLSSEA